MSDYYDREGNPISMLEWANTFEDLSYKRIERTLLENGKVVSTVWLGLNHQYGDGPPLIFETMVFPSANDFDEIDMARYSTEAEAREGHARLVKEHDTVILHEVKDRKALGA